MTAINYHFIDTHAHLDGEEFDEDRDLVVARAREAGVDKVFVPAINLLSVQTVLDTCARYPEFAHPMIGLHPEDGKDDWREVLAQMKQILDASIEKKTVRFIAEGEVGLD